MYGEFVLRVYYAYDHISWAAIQVPKLAPCVGRFNESLGATGDNNTHTLWEIIHKGIAALGTATATNNGGGDGGNNGIRPAGSDTPDFDRIFIEETKLYNLDQKSHAVDPGVLWRQGVRGY